MDLRPVACVLMVSLCACRAEPAERTDAPVEQAEAVSDTQVSAGNDVAAEPDLGDLPRRVSTYSKLTPETCRLVEENRDEGGYWRRRCPGPGGYALEWSEGDLRQDLAVLAEGRSDRLDMARLVTNGAFNNLGETVEWRGERSSPPDRLVARVNIADASNPYGPDISKLMVVRLSSPACIVAIVPPGPEQSEQARSIADGRRAECLKA